MLIINFARIGRDTRLLTTNVNKDLGFIEPTTDDELKKLLVYIKNNSIKLSNEANVLIANVSTFAQKISNAKSIGQSKDDIDEQFFKDVNSKYKAKMSDVISL